MAAAHALPVVVVTGLSGSGKSTALNVFEDLRFFCVDGLPAEMVPKMVSLFSETDDSRYKGLVLGMDLRQFDFAEKWNKALEELKSANIEVRLVFLEAKYEELLRRYSETRRPHPLECLNFSLKHALEKESEVLEPLRSQADLVVDTSEFSIHDLRRIIQDKWSIIKSNSHGLRVHLISFGFKYGVPKEADMVMDMRFLPNPYHDPELRPMSGKDKPVADYVLAGEPGSIFIDKFLNFMNYILPLYAQEGRYRMTIGIGCTGGRHRSVAVTERLFKMLSNEEYTTTIEHRHLELG